MSYDSIFALFFSKIEEDVDFFNLYNLITEEILEVAVKRSKVFLKEACAYLSSRCELEFQMEFDDEFNEIKFTPEGTSLTIKEVDLIASLMREIYYQRDLSKLKAFKVKFSPNDLKSFSPSEERRTFVDMCKFIKEINDVAIDSYSSRDRLTGKLKSIDYSLYGDI